MTPLAATRDEPAVLGVLGVLGRQHIVAARLVTDGVSELQLLQLRRVRRQGLPTGRIGNGAQFNRQTRCSSGDGKRRTLVVVWP